ncbi:hypothetical protein TH728_02850 [Corynebacterium amycolatum]|nr:hypothetical protein [Corynebacterium amycolatum]MDY7341365.1 hypothetical protein [Corynebacterium amycolatum]
MSAEFPEVRPPEGREYPGDGLTAVAVGCGGFLLVVVAVLAAATLF